MFISGGNHGALCINLWGFIITGLGFTPMSVELLDTFTMKLIVTEACFVDIVISESKH